MTPPLEHPHLADSSVWGKAATGSVESFTTGFNMAVRNDLILVCDIVALEVLRSARSPEAYREQAELLGLLESVPLSEAVHSRARDVQAALAARSQQRGIAPADLLIAAAAEAAGVPVLHYDADYDRIAAVTGQPVRWAALAGTLP